MNPEAASLPMRGCSRKWLLSMAWWPSTSAPSSGMNWLSVRLSHHHERSAKSLSDTKTHTHTKNLSLSFSSSLSLSFFSFSALSDITSSPINATWPLLWGHWVHVLDCHNSEGLQSVQTSSQSTVVAVCNNMLYTVIMLHTFFHVYNITWWKHTISSKTKRSHPATVPRSVQQEALHWKHFPEPGRLH